MAQLKTNPYDPLFLSLCANQLSLQWVASQFRAEDDRFWARLGYILGTRWDRAMIEEKDDAAAAAANPDVVSIPLAQAIRPELFGDVKKAFAQKTLNTNTAAEPKKSRVKTIEMANLDRDTFMRLINGTGRPAPLRPDEQRQRQLDAAARAAGAATERGRPPRPGP